MNRKEWLKKELEKEGEKERRTLVERAEKEAGNLEKILQDAKINEKEIKNTVLFFKLLRKSDLSAHSSLRLTFEVFCAPDKETREGLDPKNICKLL